MARANIADMNQEILKKWQDALDKWSGCRLETSMPEIKRTFPDHRVDSMPVGGICTADYRLDRIRVLYETKDGRNIIKRACVG